MDTKTRCDTRLSTNTTKQQNKTQQKMKIHMKGIRLLCSISMTLGTMFLAMPEAANAQLYVTDLANGQIGKYDLNTGATINASFVTGLNAPTGIALYSGSLFVANSGNGTVGQYDPITGATINSSLISGLSHPLSLAFSGNNIFVANYDGGTIGEYNITTGNQVGSSNFASGLSNPAGLLVNGGYLYVAAFQPNAGQITRYSLSNGSLDNSFLIKGDEVGGILSYPGCLGVLGENLLVNDGNAGHIDAFSLSTGEAVQSPFIDYNNATHGRSQGFAVLGTNVYVTDYDYQRIDLYNTSGNLAQSSFVTGLNNPQQIAVQAVPEPSTYALFGLGALVLIVVSRRKNA